MGLQSTLVGLREQGQYVSQAGSQLLILVGDDRLYRLVPFERGSPISRWPGVILDEV